MPINCTMGGLSYSKNIEILPTIGKTWITEFYNDVDNKATTTYWPEGYEGGKITFTKTNNITDGILYVGNTGPVASSPAGLGGNASMAKFDLNGNILWQIKLMQAGSNNIVFNDAIQFTSGITNDIYACGSAVDINGQQACLITRFDNLGNLIWQRLLYTTLGTNPDGTKYATYASSIGTSEAGYIYISGYIRNNTNVFNGIVGPIWAKYDLDGNLIWQKYWRNTSTDVTTRRYIYTAKVASYTTPIGVSPTLIMATNLTEYNSNNQKPVIISMLQNGLISTSTTIENNADGKIFNISHNNGAGHLIGTQLGTLNSTTNLLTSSVFTGVTSAFWKNVIPIQTNSTYDLNIFCGVDVNLGLDIRMFLLKINDSFVSGTANAAYSRLLYTEGIASDGSLYIADAKILNNKIYVLGTVGNKSVILTFDANGYVVPDGVYNTTDTIYNYGISSNNQINRAAQSTSGYPFNMEVIDLTLNSAASANISQVVTTFTTSRIEL